MTLNIYSMKENVLYLKTLFRKMDSIYALFLAFLFCKAIELISSPENDRMLTDDLLNKYRYAIIVSDFGLLNTQRQSWSHNLSRMGPDPDQLRHRNHIPYTGWGGGGGGGESKNHTLSSGTSPKGHVGQSPLGTLLIFVAC